MEDTTIFPLRIGRSSRHQGLISSSSISIIVRLSKGIKPSTGSVGPHEEPAVHRGSVWAGWAKFNTVLPNTAPGRSRSLKYLRKYISIIQTTCKEINPLLTVTCWTVSKILHPFLSHPPVHERCWYMSQQQATKVVVAGALAPWQEAEGAGPRDRVPLRAPKSSLLGCMQRLFPMVHGRRWRDGGKECPTPCQEKIFHHDCQALQPIAQGVCAVWEIFKTQLDKTVSKLVWSHSSVWFQQICQTRWPPKVPSNLNWSIENWFS